MCVRRKKKKEKSKQHDKRKLMIVSPNKFSSLMRDKSHRERFLPISWNLCNMIIIKF